MRIETSEHFLAERTQVFVHQMVVAIDLTQTLRLIMEMRTALSSSLRAPFPSKIGLSLLLYKVGAALTGQI